ncbi:hypothetical protein HMPREF3034_01232 [Prevotella sp. DNF00663]|nr:hypothetical protein HMPREF3034_01232 [Prevotella sp. DNF00663]
MGDEIVGIVLMVFAVVEHVFQITDVQGVGLLRQAFLEVFDTVGGKVFYEMVEALIVSAAQHEAIVSAAKQHKGAQKEENQQDDVGNQQTVGYPEKGM